MRSKAPLSLIEYLIMILVFSISIAICLKVFAFSDTMSRDSVNKGMSYSVARQTAETLKSCSGDMEKAAEMLGFKYEDGKIISEYDDIRMTASLEDTGMEYLGGAVISAVSGEKELCTIHIRWQEGLAS